MNLYYQQKSNEIETIDATNISDPNDTPYITHKVTRV